MSVEEKLGIVKYQLKKLHKREKAIIQNEGFVPFLKSMAKFSIKPFFAYSWHYLYEEMLDTDVVVPPHRLENLTVKELHIPTMSQFEYEALDEDLYDFEGHPDVRDYVPKCGEGPKTGIVMLYATVNGEFVHRNAATLTAEGTYYGKFCKTLNPPFYSLNDVGTIYRVLCVTNPKYRGKGIYAHLEFEMHNFLRRKGYSKIVYSCDPSMIFDLHIFDAMGCNTKFKLYQLKVMMLFDHVWNKPCKEQPLDELGIPRKHPRGGHKLLKSATELD